MAAAVVAHRGANVFRDRIDAAAQLVDALRVELRMFFERGVQVGDVCLVMLPVMNLHRLRVDVRLERGEVVRKLGKFVRHASSTWARLSQHAKERNRTTEWTTFGRDRPSSSTSDRRRP